MSSSQWVKLVTIGEDFCRVCLSSQAGALEGLPSHSAPKDTAITPRPHAELPEGG